MERTLIAWNFPNWFTIFLMAASGYAAAGLIAQFFKKRAPSQPASAGGQY